MRMKIKYKTGLFLGLLNLFFDMIDRRCGIFGRFLPNSIRIDSCQFCPCIAMNDTIWIDHRDDLKDIVVEESVLSLDCLHHN